MVAFALAPANRGNNREKRRRKNHRKAERVNGLLRRQRTFLLEKLVGLNDKEAALAAGYALSVAENTKQKIWAKPLVQAEFDRLKSELLAIRAHEKHVIPATV